MSPLQMKIFDDIKSKYPQARKTPAFTNNDRSLVCLDLDDCVTVHIYGSGSVFGDGAQRWLLNGVQYRKDGPSAIWPDGLMDWSDENGFPHRDGFPAQSSPGGFEAWMQHGKAHRVGKPAVVIPGRYEAWLQNDKLHREDGPALTYLDGRHYKGEAVTYWLHGKKVKPF